MEEGSVMEEGSTNSRAGRWIKEIFKKKEEGEVEQNDVSDETPAANGHKTMDLADISEEEEEMKETGDKAGKREVVAKRRSPKKERKEPLAAGQERKTIL